MIVTDYSRFSGKGTPMVSRFGSMTIAKNSCFKEIYRDEELARIGL